MAGLSLTGWRGMDTEEDVPRAAVDDPVWVLRMYEEAKEIVEDILTDLQSRKAVLGPDLRARLGDFHIDTFMDRCTTMGIDCGCNTRDERSERDSC